MQQVIKYWPLITGLVIASAAFGESRVKIHNLEQAVVEQANQSQQINSINAKQHALDERTQIMMEILRQQNKLLLEIRNRGDS